jgi:small conductance mechanosensitive channel
MQTDSALQVINQTLGHWQERFFELLPDMITAIIVLTLFYFLAKCLKRISLRAGTRLFSNNERMTKVVATLVFLFTEFAGIILALDILNLTTLLTHLLAGAGIMGIVVGFAFKDIASNVFSGLLIKSQQPFKSGHWVKIDEYLGKVQEIGMITTILQTQEGKFAYVPNQLIYNGVFLNYSTLGKQRAILSSGVSYGDDLDKVKSVVLDLVKHFDFVSDKENVDFYFTDIGSSTYNFEVRFWIEFQDYSQYLEARSEMIMQIKKCFEQQNISIAYNVTTLDFGVKGGVNLFDKAVKIQDL